MLFTLLSCSLNGFCGGKDHIDHQLWAGEHGDVAAGNLMRGSAHALRNEPLQLGLHGAVLGGHDVGARLRSPRYAIKLLCEQVRSVPAVVIDGKLASCWAGRGPEEKTLQAALAYAGSSCFVAHWGAEY